MPIVTSKRPRAAPDFISRRIWIGWANGASSSGPSEPAWRIRRSITRITLSTPSCSMSTRSQISAAWR